MFAKYGLGREIVADDGTPRFSARAAEAVRLCLKEQVPGVVREEVRRPKSNSVPVVALHGYLLHGGEQLSHVQRFAKDPGARIAPVRAACRHDQNRDPRQLRHGLQTTRELPAVHHRHEEIEQDGNRRGVTREVRESHLAVAGFGDGIARLLEHSSECVPYLGIVVHDENDRRSWRFGKMHLDDVSSSESGSASPLPAQEGSPPGRAGPMGEGAILDAGPKKGSGRRCTHDPEGYQEELIHTVSRPTPRDCNPRSSLRQSCRHERIAAWTGTCCLR
jgi:hypothetical protein